MYSRAFLCNMTENLQADGVQSRQTLFVRYCPWECVEGDARITPRNHNSRFAYKPPLKGEGDQQSWWRGSPVKCNF